MPLKTEINMEYDISKTHEHDTIIHSELAEIFNKACLKEATIHKGMLGYGSAGL
jgi:PII-like signaling protein